MRLTGLTVQRVAREDEEMEQGVLEPTEKVGIFPPVEKSLTRGGRLQRVGCDERRLSRVEN